MLEITLKVTEFAYAKISCYPDKIEINGVPVDADILFRTLKLAACSNLMEVN